MDTRPGDEDNPTLSELQAYEELRMFELFLEYAQLPVIRSTIESRSPPAPDVLCQLESGERVAFELGELSDPEYRKNESVMLQFRKLLWRCFRELPDEIREALTKRYWECRIDVTFRPEVSLRRCEDVVRVFYRWLADQKRLIGTLASNQLPAEVGCAIPQIRISETSPALWIEPAFGMNVSEPDLSVFEKKLGKMYEQTYPIELLLHSTWPLRTAWFERYVETLRAGIDGSPFRRVWIFSPTERTHLDPVRFVYPQFERSSGVEVVRAD